MRFVDLGCIQTEGHHDNYTAHLWLHQQLLLTVQHIWANTFTNEDATEINGKSLLVQQRKTVIMNQFLFFLFDEWKEWKEKKIEIPENYKIVPK